MKPLRELLKKWDDPFFAEDWNSLLRQAQSRVVNAGVVNTREPEETFDWKVSTARFDAHSHWKVFVGVGFINDVIPSIVYLQRADPRGWVMPEDYPLPEKGEAGYSEFFANRDLLEADPPFLLVSAPPSPVSNVDFHLVSDAARIPFFRTAEMWEKTIFSAHVILTAAPWRPNFFPSALPPPPLSSYRVAVIPRLWSRSFAALAGGWIELARLFLVRDEKEGAPGDRLLVQQREFHSLAAAIVQPKQVVGGSIEAPVTGLALVDSFAMGMAASHNAVVSQVQAEVDNILATTASVEFWTV